MKPWRLIFVVTTLGLLCACAGQQATPGASATPASKAPAPKAKKVDIQVANLPCAEISDSETLQISYPGESLYRGGAALPKEEGLACLEVLTDWLKGASHVSWQISVGGEEGYSFDPLALAGKRQELLQQFFARKGIDTKNWQWQAVNKQGLQLQFEEAKDSP